MPKNFNTGDSVKIKSLRKNGIIDSFIGTNKARVAIGSLQITCKFDDLELIPKKEKNNSANRYQSQQYSHLKSGHAPDTIDLHGMYVEDAIHAVATAIDNAILSDLDCFKIIHGIGEGKIKLALDNYLKSLPVVKSQKLDPNNSGVTIVYF